MKEFDFSAYFDVNSVLIKWGILRTEIENTFLKFLSNKFRSWFDRSVIPIIFQIKCVFGWNPLKFK